MAVNLSPVGGVAQQFFTNNGVPLSGGLIYTYTAGSTTPAATYTSSIGTTAHTNPIVLDSGGRIPGGETWLTDGITYKFVLKDSNDVLIATYDNISGINSNFVNFTNQQEIQTATAGQTVFTLATMQYQPATGSLSVFVDGVNQYGPDAQYAFTETSSTVVTFASGLHVGASVKFTTSTTNSSSYGTAFDISYTPPFTASVPTNVGDKLAQYISVKDFGAIGDGTTDDTIAFQAAIDALTDYQTLVAEGSFYTTESLYLRKNNVTYDFNAAKFLHNATVVVADIDSPTTQFSNIRILGGSFYPVGDSQPYPAAAYNPIAILIAKNVTVINPKIYPVQSCRAISIQTSDFWGTAPYQNISNISVINAEIYGDDNAADGIDITSDNADNMIQDVYVSAYIEGCKRGFAVSTGSNSYNFSNINLDLIINGTDETIGSFLRVKNSSLKVKAQYATAEGISIQQINNTKIDVQIQGSGASLGTGLRVEDTPGTIASQNVISAKIAGAFNIGVLAACQDAIFMDVEIDGAVTYGIENNGERHVWNNVVFKNCGTNIKDPTVLTDRWLGAVDQKTGVNAVIVKRDYQTADGVNSQFSADAAYSQTITIASNATSKPFASVNNFSGMLMIDNATTSSFGTPAMFLMGGSSYFVGGDSTKYSNTAATASKVNVYYDGSGYVTIENKTASSITIKVFSIRMKSQS